MSRFRNILFSLALSATVLPAQQLLLNEGDFEAGGSGMIDSDALSGSARFGAFILDYLQLGGKLDLADNDVATRVGLSVYLIKLFETNTYLIPYLGGSIGYASLDVSGDKSESGAESALIGGLKYYMADNVSLNSEVTAGYSSGETFLDEDGGDTFKLMLTIGIGFHW